MQQRQNATEPISRAAIDLYHRYAPTIFTYICRHDISREDAEDLIVEVFTAAVERDNLPDLQEGEKLAWLKRVAHNKLIDNYRRLTRRPEATLEEAERHHDAQLSPEQSALQQEEYRRRSIHEISRSYGHFMTSTAPAPKTLSLWQGERSASLLLFSSPRQHEHSRPRRNRSTWLIRKLQHIRSGMPGGIT